MDWLIVALVMCALVLPFVVAAQGTHNRQIILTATDGIALLHEWRGDEVCEELEETDETHPLAQAVLTDAASTIFRRRNTLRA